MKTEINHAVKASGIKIDEILLFRAMAKEFNKGKVSKCTYVEEIHGNKGMVEFSSMYKTGGSATVELGDLLLITFDKATNELRICVLQAKFKKGKFYRFINFQANLFQWELLLNKPIIKNASTFNFPPNILNFRKDYDSITAYGIFYEDNISKDIDFLYTIPKNIKPYSTPSRHISNGIRSFNFNCPIGSGSPNSLCKKGISRMEAISTCSIDVFEKQVLSCKVGAPIDISISSWVVNILKRMQGFADNPTVIEEILEFTDNDNMRLNDSSLSGDFPSAIIVITDSRHYNDLYSENIDRKK